MLKIHSATCAQVPLNDNPQLVLSGCFRGGDWTGRYTNEVFGGRLFSATIFGKFGRFQFSDRKKKKVVRVQKMGYRDYVKVSA
jgi:hypothetical protein